eukprot:980686_1
MGKAQVAGSNTDKKECVKVVVRVRPLNSKEKERSEKTIVKVSNKAGIPQIAVKRSSKRDEYKTFAFDHVYGADSTQQQIFEEAARPIVDSVIDGYNGTIFAYGQTGTGKTFTMEGVIDDDNLKGIMPNTFERVFQRINEESGDSNFLVRASFLEIYNDDVYDLLSKSTRQKLDVKEGKDGFYVPDLTAYGLKSVKEVLKVLRKGTKNRTVGATKMNPGSSRSHSIFSVIVESSVTGYDGEIHYKMGKLNLVDLAGSERQKKTGSEGTRLLEAKNINLSLSALGNVIKALVNPKATHVPFRDSKLTRLLQDSLGGNTKTVMVANIGPVESNMDETMSTLRYANRAKNIQNKPVINEDPKDALLRKMQEDILELKRQLECKQAGLPPDAEKPIIEERVVEKIVVKHSGVNPQEYEKNKNEIEEEKKRLLQEHSEEKKTALDSKEQAEATAASLQQQLDEQSKLLEEEQQAADRLESVLKEKADQLLQGGEALGVAARQKQELKRARHELHEAENHTQTIEKNIEEAAEAEDYIHRKYASRQEELQVAYAPARISFTWRRSKQNG